MAKYYMCDRYILTSLVLAVWLRTSCALLLHPTVTISGGVVIGTSDPIGGQDRFLGIPFALPPVGNLRLRAPQSLTANFGTLTATTLPSGCPQLTPPPPKLTIPTAITASIATGTPSVFGGAVENSAEDCLYLNVQRPTNTNSTAALPVVAWIYGGGFELGSASQYDGQLMLAKAVQLGHPYIFVAMNYRVAAFGFLAGAQLSQEGNTNLGLRDQRAALEWISDNIAAFGGDPAKVTIWGESAGSWSVMDHTTINQGNNTYNGKPLFRAAIMDSGAIYPALPVRHPKPQAVFDGLVRDAGCASAPDELACLREVDYSTFLSAQNNQTYPHGFINYAYVARPDPSNAFFANSPEVAARSCAVTKVPIICGNQMDEGTVFAVTITDVDGSNDTQMIELLEPVYPEASVSTLQALLSTYPQAPSAGTPYNTGILNELYPGFKRLASVLGDIEFILARRIYLDYVSGIAPAWSYLGNYDYGTPFLGTTHATDVLAIFYGLTTPTALDEIFTRYISFITYLDPNVIGMKASTQYQAWPEYTVANRSLLVFGALGVSVGLDAFRQASYQDFEASISSFKV